jgi:hypothetical protein
MMKISLHLTCSVHTFTVAMNLMSSQVTLTISEMDYALQQHSSKRLGHY